MLIARVVDARAPLAWPTVVWNHTDDTDWIGTVPTDGLIRLPEGATTRRVDITIVEHEIRRSISMFDRFFTTLPPGISEVRFDPAVNVTETPTVSAPST